MVIKGRLGVWHVTTLTGRGNVENMIKEGLLLRRKLRSMRENISQAELRI